MVWCGVVWCGGEGKGEEEGERGEGSVVRVGVGDISRTPRAIGAVVKY